MISLDDYFGKWKSVATEAHRANAISLLSAVNALHDELIARGLTFPYNPKTNTLISGTEYGGYRPADCPQGAPTSSHKEGRGIDIYDPYRLITPLLYDDYLVCRSIGKESDCLLAKYNLYMEHPDSTSGWCHLTDRAPKSKRRVFYP